MKEVTQKKLKKMLQIKEVESVGEGVYKITDELGNTGYYKDKHVVEYSSGTYGINGAHFVFENENGGYTHLAVAKRNSELFALV